MLWIKRNLLLAVVGIVAIALLAVGGLYVSSGLSKNKTLSDEVEGTRTRLNNIYTSPDPFPHATNIAAAKAEAAKLHAAVTKTKKHFVPVPAERVDVKAFRTLRDKTIEEMRDMAVQAKTKLPSGTYAFSFETQKSRTDFGAGTFPVVPEQMMEVKALCSILFGARISALGNIRRARVSADDRSSSIGGDYLAPVLANQTITAASAESHPYELTYYCFSSDLAQVLNGLARSPHGFTVKALMIEPDMADAGGAGMAAAEVAPPNNPGVRPPPGGGRFGPGGRQPGGANPPPRPGVAPPRPAGSDRPVILLKEKRLKVTMLVYAIK